MKKKLTDLNKQEKENLAMLLSYAEYEDFDNEEDLADWRLASNLDFNAEQFKLLLKVFKKGMARE